ncbi:MAG TPA: tail fiber domain-containing protein [Thermoanaerobaculia bacterium]|nr:tail fiber domain-containing protein [Thermoanaerobaculia bacterium]
MLLVALLALILIPTLGFAQKAPEPIGRTQAGLDTIEWPLTASGDSVMLTVVSPSDDVYVADFTSGRTPSVRLRDLGLGKVPPDGVYHYELRLTPRISTAVKSQLKAARQANDDVAARRIMRDNGILFTTVQSGAFVVVNGSIVNPDAEEGSVGIGKIKASATAKSGAAGSGESIMKLIPKANDQVIPDDLIVQGSACVGLDCVNGESFGFDTIRLKENNTRIKFDDTSTGAGFPNNDWQLTANDSGGGANKFSIDDVTNSKTPFTITAGASTNSIFVDSTGRVGLRTSTPVLDLHISTSNTPAIRQEQTNAGGFTAQTWDIGANEANWFVRDVTGGSRLPLRIRPGAPTSSVDISASGNVGIGTASPDTLLDVERTDTAATIIRVNANNTAGIAILRANSGNGTTSPRFSYFEAMSDESGGADWRTGLHGSKDYRISDFATGSEANRVFISATNGNIGLGGQTSPTSPIHHLNGATLSSGGAWINASSRDLKDDICDLEANAAEETLKQLNPVTFRYKAEPASTHVGFIAEDVPNLVATQDRKGLSAMDIVAVLTKVVQDQQKTIEQLSAKVDELAKKQQ